ncbi:MAG: hypothetical protein R3C26_09135 [Calditrichia bacterium]
MTLSFVIVNAGEHPVSPEMQLSLQPVLRTCQTYAWKYPADISRDSETRTVVAEFPMPMRTAPRCSWRMLPEILQISLCRGIPQIRKSGSISPNIWRRATASHSPN